MADYQSQYTGAQHDAYVTKESLIDLIYPVGAIYMSVNSVSPSTLFGGTWTQIQDTFLLAAGQTYTAGSNGGSSTHTHTTQAHTLTVAEMPSHTHNGLFWTNPDEDAWNVTLDPGTAGYKLSWTGSGGSTTAGAGKGSEHLVCVGRTGGRRSLAWRYQRRKYFTSISHRIYVEAHGLSAQGVSYNG